MTAPGRSTWRYKEKAKDFHARHNYAPYTMVPNTALESEMADTTLPNRDRVLAAVRRYSWGNLSDYAVDVMPRVDPNDPEPRPLAQKDLARILQMPISSVGDVCSLLKSQKYLRSDTDYLYPDDKSQPSLFTSRSDPPSDIDQLGVKPDSPDFPSPYLRFEKTYLADNKDFSAKYTTKCDERDLKYAEARLCAQEVRTMKRVILAAFRDWERQHKRDSNSANETGGSPDPAPQAKARSAAADTDSAMAASGSPSIHRPELTPDSTQNGSRLQPNPSATPGEFVRDSGVLQGDSQTEIPLSTNVSSADFDALLNSSSLKVEGQPSSGSVGRSAEDQSDRPTDPPDPSGLAERRAAILAAIPSELCERLHDLPSPLLMQRIEEKLAGAPPDSLTEKIRLKWKKITALGLLEGLAEDVGRVWQSGAVERQAAAEAEERRQRDAETYAADRHAFDDYETSALTTALDSMPADEFAAMVKAARKELSVSQPERWGRLTESLRQEDAEHRARQNVKASLGLMAFEEFRGSRRLGTT